VLGGVTAVPLVALGLWSASKGACEPAAGFMTFAVNGFLLFYVSGYLEGTYRTTNEFTQLAGIQVAQAVVAVLLVAAAWWLGFYGLCLRSLGVGVAGLLLL